MPRTAIIDFETRAARDLKKTGVEAYTECPHFLAQCLSWTFDDGADEPIVNWQIHRGAEIMGADAHAAAAASAQELFGHVARGGHVVAHNARFELSVWRELHRRDPATWPDLKPEQLTDTMALARAVGMPAALFDLACALRLKLEKDADGHRLMLKLCKPRKPRKDEKHLPGPLWHEDAADLARQLVYCGRDVEVERAVWRLLPPLIPAEADTWQCDQWVNDNGVHVDVEAAHNCLALVEAEKARLNGELMRITSGYVATAQSTQALMTWLGERGCPLPDLRKNTVEAALFRDDLAADVRDALMIRRECARSGTAKLQAAILGACKDGRLHGLFGYHGAGPGRWIGHRFQPQNMMRAPEKFDEYDTEEVFAWAAQ